MRQVYTADSAIPLQVTENKQFSPLYIDIPEAGPRRLWGYFLLFVEKCENHENSLRLTNVDLYDILCETTDVDSNEEVLSWIMLWKR